MKVAILNGYLNPYGNDVKNIEDMMSKYLNLGYELDKFIHITENEYTAVMIKPSEKK